VPSEEDIPIPSVEGGDAPPVVPYHHLGLRFGLGL
jgi:hypothetical protein